MLERFADELDLVQFHMDQVTELAITAIRQGSGLAAGREYCLDCDCRIPAKRLVHMPSATRCVPCQDRQERGSIAPPLRQREHQPVDDGAGGGDVVRVVQDQVAVDLDGEGLFAAQGSGSKRLNELPPV